ncbi:hypothetical protein METBIDRAFT_44684 [Metschnikowia bicuspidata var. bicuspidata NRRL YB-4993]|uniref:Protein kinase domain-containing protein n=1 Tax=Metschnikowia bicuspidata var. bicuspidata NRRL YB-4993 TaxID=869754 RepID=A0A1A0H7I9_9ASCO|nr:hypothetical protein METBIDRAFT_44684 [Metschnikowia bicuspidata var. bicuspidata NRRL YB-4993]OBA19945.1 hypothetical protein METBIDRAFT_44684 [Metschnikowia bicuspidata var. bicuspidata NRRL YB-4993]
MDFLSSALSLISTKSIPYTFKEKIVDPALSCYPEKCSVWTVYNGINPKNECPVSIFEFSLKDPANSNYTKLAINCYRKLKLIKFPGVLGIVDFIENESFLYIITERITPLTKYLQEHGEKISKDARIYGIYNVSVALSLINTLAHCVHGRLDLASSVYVNAQGDWKLFGFELLTNLRSDPDQPIYRLAHHLPNFDENLPPEVIERGAEAIRESPLKFDSYKLGVFITALFSAEIPDCGNIPRSLSTAVHKLLAPNKKRIDVESFASETSNYFKSNRLVKFAQLLEEITFQDQSSKLAFFRDDIAEYIEGDLPPGFLDYKVLPEIIQQYKFVISQKPTVNSTPEEHASRQETNSVLLNHILKLSSSIPDDAFSKNIKPIIFTAFALSDRAIRLLLLKHLPEFRRRLTDTEVQTKVFHNLLTGLQDTNFLIRETTLTSITSIIDKVSVKQVNQDLLKILAKLQMDPKPSIRTNTLILIINISNKIYSTSRNSVVITALAKSLRDSFTPCKLAALSGFERLIESFSLEEICSKILGHLAIALMDPKSFKIRQESKRIFELYLNSVEIHAASLPQNEEDEDAEEKEFYKNSSGASENTEAAVPEPQSSLSIGWSVVNRLVTSRPTHVNGTLNKVINTSTPEIDTVSSPQRQNTEWEEALDYDYQWENDGVEDELSPVAAAPKSSVPALLLSSRIKASHSTSPKASSSSSRLTLSSNKKSPGSTLKLDLDIDAEEDTWGDDW